MKFGGVLKCIVPEFFSCCPNMSGSSGRGRQRFKRRLDFSEFVFAEILEAKHHIPGVLVGADEFVELELDGGCVTVLGVLEEEAARYLSSERRDL